MNKKIQMRPDHKVIQKQTNFLEQKSPSNVSFQINMMSTKNLQSPPDLRETTEYMS